MPVLEVCNVTKIYRMGTMRIAALDEVTFTVEHGEFAAIVGPSGSGKSTLMHILGCLDVPTSGSYFIEGVDVSHMNHNQLAATRNQKIGFVFQRFNLLPNLTALDNVALPQLYAGKGEAESREIAQKFLERVDLGDRLSHYPYQLSGGQQQRVAIARSLVNNPAIILADEPTGALDSKIGKRILDVFIDLNTTEKITVILITHDPAIAQKTKRVITILDGRIMEDKTSSP